MQHDRISAVTEPQPTPNEVEAAALARVESWDRAMQRTFKGILPRPTRRAMLQRATEAVDA